MAALSQRPAPEGTSGGYIPTDQRVFVEARGRKGGCQSSQAFHGEIAVKQRISRGERTKQRTAPNRLRSTYIGR